MVCVYSRRTRQKNNHGELDVVAFDTTYKTNKYELVFGVFTGVNHHGQ